MKPKATFSAVRSPTPTPDTLQAQLGELLRPGQSVDLLKALHILTRDGKVNQDSRRKLKQVNHLTQFIGPLIETLRADTVQAPTIVDHGAGKSYLGFMLYDLFMHGKSIEQRGQVFSVETRAELVASARALAKQLKFDGMEFLHLSAAESLEAPQLPASVGMVTALHACDTATDDAIRFALAKKAKHLVLVPCCQAEVAATFRAFRAFRALRESDALRSDTTETESAASSVIGELWRRPLHTREFGSQITNVMRCLQLEAHGYQVTVTELVGWEHSMKNELIIATQKNLPGQRAAKRLKQMLDMFNLSRLHQRFFVPTFVPTCVPNLN
jgi:Methyltransferase domain